MFHVSDNLFFGRTAEGGVRILKLNTTPSPWPKVSDEPYDRYDDKGNEFAVYALLDVVVDECSWVSVIDAVSFNPGQVFSLANEIHRGIGSGV